MSGNGYDPELPILAELEAEVTRAAAARRGPASAEPQRPEPRPTAAAPAAAARESAWRPLARIPRRAAVLALLGCMVGATATATVRILDGRTATGPSHRVLVERATTPEARDLTVHVQRRQVCTTLVLPATVDTACAPIPHPSGGLARSAVGSFTRYVFGLTGDAVGTVDVTVGGRSQRVATQPLPTAAARLPGASGLRWFMLTLDRPAGARDPLAVVQLYTREHATPRATLVDCSLGQIDRRCPPG